MLFAAPKQQITSMSTAVGKLKYVILPVRVVSANIGVSVADLRGLSLAAYTSEMDRFAGAEVVLTKVLPKTVRVIRTNGSTDVSSYTWKMEYLKLVGEPAEKLGSQKPGITLDKSVKYKILLDSGAIVLENVSALDLQPIDEPGFYSFKIRDYIGQFGASDWYTINSLCTTMFGSGERSYVCIHENAILPMDTEVIPSESVPEKKSTKEKHYWDYSSNITTDDVMDPNF